MGYKSRTSAVEKKKFMFLSIGFEKPTPEVMGAWGKWFESISSRMVEQGGFWSGGREFTKTGSNALPFGEDSITGYVVFSADSIEEAEKIAQECPVVASNRVYEIMSK